MAKFPFPPKKPAKPGEKPGKPAPGKKPPPFPPKKGK
jgi:hypothetical protein